VVERTGNRIRGSIPARPSLAFPAQDRFPGVPGRPDLLLSVRFPPALL
jgi:hypothetical protein